MNKPPAFQFYPKDFLADINVSIMTMEERGVYITLLSHCWLEGWLPNGSTKLKRICNNPSNWKELWENVRHCFYENGDKLYHKRLEGERKKQLEWREKSREGGIKSGEARRKKKVKRKGGSKMVEPNANQRATLQSSYKKKYNKEEITKISFSLKTEKWENIKDKEIKRWKETYPACDVETELLFMADWLISHPEKRKSNYKAFISRWLRKSQDSGGTKKQKIKLSAYEQSELALKKSQERLKRKEAI